MSRKGQSITLSISDRDKAQLEQIAREQGMLWGDRPNISRLVEAIARRELLIGRNNDWSDERIRALQQAIRALLDTGQVDAGETLAKLLLDRSELSIPLRAEIEQLVATPVIPWRQMIDQYIHRHQPFRLTYCDAVDRPWSFTIRHAKVTFREKRQYLECWCEETEGNQDLEDLKHNWPLRLDRIADAALEPVHGQWRDALEEIEVEMHILRGLAFSYQSRPEDSVNEWMSGQSHRKVIRRVSSTFWFFREILPYGEDCVLIAPDSVRDCFKQKLNNLSRLYNDNPSSEYSLSYD